MWYFLGKLLPVLMFTGAAPRRASTSSGKKSVSRSHCQQDIVRGKLPTDSRLSTAKVGSHLQLIMLFSGMLPLFMPILCLAWMCETCVMASVAKGGAPELGSQFPLQRIQNPPTLKITQKLHLVDPGPVLKNAEKLLNKF